MKKIFVIFLALVMCMSAVVFQPCKINSAAGLENPTDLGLVGLDYQAIYDHTKYLSEIIKDPDWKHNSIWMGRWFGTKGEQHASAMVQLWMSCCVDWYTSEGMVIEQPTMEQITLKNKIDIQSFSLTLSDGYNHAIIINNESYPQVRNFWNLTGKDTWDCAQVDIIPFSNNRLDDEWDVRNISYTRFKESNLSNIPFAGELVYIEDYSNTTENETYGKIHLINVSDNEINETVNNVFLTNGSAFILMRDDIENISCWDFLTPGIAVSRDNGKFLYDKLQIENNLVFAYTPPEVPLPYNGTLTVYNQTIPATTPANEMFLVDNADMDPTSWFILGGILLLPRYKGALYYDSTLNDEDSYLHWMMVPNGFESDYLKDGKLYKQSWATMTKPIFYINHTVRDQHVVPHEIEDWVGNGGNVHADFTLHTQKIEAQSYNVYCTIKGHNPGKRVIISGGHIDGMIGQMAIDTPGSVAAMLGILKYMNDNQIEPKYDTTFIAFSGEEYIDRGSRSYLVHHFPPNGENNDIATMINVDVFGSISEDCENLDVVIGNITSQSWSATARNKVENISYLTNYPGIIKVTGNQNVEFKDLSTDAYPFYKKNVAVINIGEQQDTRTRHKTGCNHTKGDTLDHLDWRPGERDDLKLTTDFVWNITKYYIVNPNCWFLNDVTYDDIDSPNDGDTLVDSIQATFAVNSVIPNDKIMVKAILIDDSTSEEVATAFKNFTVVSSEATGTISVLIPSTYDEGDFRLSLELYNSTGKIDLIISPGGDYDDDTDSSIESFHLYHPFGNIITGKYSQRIDNRITGSVFTTHENGTADSITAFVFFPPANPPSKCMIYRLSDSMLIGETEEISGSTLSGGEWRTYDFIEPKPVLLKDTQYVLVCWCSFSILGGKLYYDNFVNARGRYDNENYDGVPPQYASFTNENRLYSIYCSYTRPHAYSTYYLNRYNVLEAWATNPRNMVDGLITTFASSNICEDVELCNSNSCPGVNLGDISKVEIRAYTYRTGGLGSIILRPIFGGNYDGNNHGFTPPLGSSQATWSSWFDITNDDNSPTTWTWSDIQNLDCDVQIGAMASFPVPTMYCSKVEIRITYLL
jgi:hypothetical protein